MSKWTSFADLEKEIETLAHIQQVIYSKNTRNHTKSQFHKVFGEDTDFKKVVRKGDLYCGTKKNCSFRLPFRWNDEDRSYSLNMELLNLRHGHGINCKDIRIASRELIMRQKAMTVDEREFAMQLGTADLETPKVREMMRSKFPGRDFDAHLLYRLLEKGRKRVSLPG
jgi:hypothetical protein